MAATTHTEHSTHTPAHAAHDKDAHAKDANAKEAGTKEGAPIVEPRMGTTPQALQAVFVHGDPLMVDWTPVVDTPAGTVVDRGTSVGIVHAYSKANVVSALAVGGNSVYDVIKKAGDVVPLWGLVYWTVATNTATITGPADALIGKAVQPAAAGDVSVRVMLIEGTT